MAYSSEYTKQVLNGTYGKKKKQYTSKYVEEVLSGKYKPSTIETTKTQAKKDVKSVLETTKNTKLQLPTVTEASKYFKKEEDKPWYQEFFKSSGAFKDGYDFGDVTKTVGSSAADAVLNVGGGILGVVEGITDLLTYGAGEVLDIVGADETAEKFKANAKYSWTDSMLNQPKHHFNQNSVFGDTSDKVFQGIGTTLGFYAGGAAVKVAGKAIGAGANALGKAGTALSATDKATKAAKVANAAAKVVNTTAKATDKVAKVMQTGNVALKLGKHSLNVPIAVLASASGSGISEAYSKGNVEDWQAWTSGVGSGIIEGMAEGMFGMFGIGGSSLDDALTGTAMAQFKSGFGKGMAKVGVQAFGEGSEEVVSYLGNYLLNHGVDFASQLTGDTDVKLGEDFSWEDLAENFVVGAASAFLMGGASTTVDVTKAQNNAIKAAEESLGRKLTAEEKKSVKKQTSLQLMQDTEAEMLNKKSESEQKLVDNYVNSKAAEITKEKAIEAEVEKAIKTREAEQGGVLSARNKEALKKSITAKIESGEIDISGTKLSNKDLKKIQAEVEANLEAGKYNLQDLEDILTPEKTAQLKALETQLSKTKSKAKKAEIQDQINNLVASKATDLKEMLGENKYLNTAVYESLQSTESYKYEESQVQDEYVKGVYESAKTHANNTTDTRNFVENVAKLAKDRKTSYRFTNNQELKEQGDLLERENLSKDEQAQITALEAKLAKAKTEAEKKKLQNQIDEIKYYDIGGFVRKNVDGVETVLLNIDSKQSMSAVVGHETKHLLEKNELNKDFNKLLFDYAKTKGDYDTYKKRIEKLYDGKGDVESELAAALTGDYLFTDSKFIETLLNNENKTLGQKIKDLIDDLIIKFKGTDQEKQLREVQKKFKELYKQQSQTVSATQETNTQYSISATTTDNQGRTLTKEQQEFFKDSKVRDEQGNLLTMYHSTNAEFNEYDISKSGKNYKGWSEYGAGFYFSPNEPSAKIWGENARLPGKVLIKEQYLNIANPFRVYGKNVNDVELLVKEIEDKYNEKHKPYSTLELSDGVRASGGRLLDYMRDHLAYTNSQIRELLKKHGFDGIDALEFDEKGIVKGQIVAFEPNQIKNVDNLNPTENPDIRYSLSNKNDIAPIGDYNIYGRDMKVQEVQDEIAETAEVSEVGSRLEEDTTRIREEATREVGELKAELNIRARDAIRNNLELDYKAVDDIVTKIHNKDNLTEQDIYDAFEGHRELVEPIDENTLKEREYVKGYLKGRKINLGKAYKSDVNGGEFNDFRRKYFGKTNFVLNGGENIDVAYMELSEVFPHLFPADITHPADQAIQIAEVLDEVYGPKTQTYELTDTDLANVVNEIYGGYTVIENYRNIYKEKYGIDIFETSQNANTDTLSTEASNLSSDTQNASKRVKLSETDTTRNKAPATSEEIAEVLADEPVTPKKKDRKLGILAASILDKGLVFENLSLKTKNRFLMAKWDYTLTSNARAQNVIGQGHYEYDPATKTHKKVSDSLDEIRAKVANAGLVKEFYYYMYNNLNMDRMSLESRAKAKAKELRKTLKELTAQENPSKKTIKQINKLKAEIERLKEVKNKPVFGDKITAEMSQERVKEIEAQHPEFADYAKSVYDYERAERQLLVKGGVISQETADLWEEMYPHFVPIRRVDKQGPAINVALDTGRTGINAPIQRATGGNTDILPLFDTMAQRTLQTHRAVAKNSFGVELKNTLDSARTGSQASVDEIIDSVDMHEGLLKEGVNGRNPTFTVFENGERVEYEITQAMYDALKPLSDSSLLSKTSKILNTASSFHRGVLTQYNPVFMLTNAIKDVQDVLINSQHPFSTYKKIPEAFAQLTQKGYWYQEYMANGGEQNSYFDSQDNTFDTERKGISKVLDWFPLKQIADMNDFVEMVPRLAEYIASREAGRSVEVSMLDAARVTTNFKAGGDLTKFLNRNGVTFLNASVQGAMQQARNIREANANGFKGWAMLATKFAVASVPVAILNALIWSDDDEYEELSEYVKENYYIVGKYGDGNFIRIPKGRTVAVIQDALQQIVDVSTGDDEADLKGFLELMATNLAPNNPIENNILSPIVQVVTEKTWYGEDLIPQRLQGEKSKEQYDESTDMFSRWLGENLNISPIKINYLLDQYTGGLGDVVLPMMTPEATSGTDSIVGNVLAPLTKKFTTNSIMNNQNVSDFYSTSEKLTEEANANNATDEDELRKRYMNSVKADMNELYAEKRKIQNSSLPKSEKWEKVQAVQKQINELSKKGLDNYEKVDDYGTYATVGDREYYKRINSDGEEEWTKVKDKEAQELNELGLTKSQKDTYFSTKIEISNIVNDYKDDKEILENLDEDSDEYKDAVAKLSSDKKASIASMVKNTNLNDEQKAYLYKKYYNSDTIDTLLLSGVSMNAYLDFASQDIRADVNKYGKTISGSKKEKVEEYINSMRGINYYQKIILFKSQYTADDRYNNDIIDYLNSNDDISYNDMVYILKELGFTVKNDKISW